MIDATNMSLGHIEWLMANFDLEPGDFYTIDEDGNHVPYFN